MIKTLLLMFILYLFYFIFTNFSCRRETMIDLSLTQNQYISYSDKNNVNYVMIRLTDIVNENNEPNYELISNIYENISKSEDNFDNLAQQNSKLAIESIKKGPTQIIREPLLAVKINDVNKLTNNNIITGSLRNLPNNKIILAPFLSKNNPNNLEGKNISNRIIKLDKILFLDITDKMPSDISDLKKVYLQPIYRVNNIDIFLIKDNGTPSNEIILY